MNRLTQTYTAVAEYSDVIERTLAIALMATIAVSASLYMYLVASAAYAAAETKTLSREVVRVEGALASLEARYHVAREAVTRNAAESFGLVAYDNTVFAQLDAGAALSIEVR